MDLSSHKWTPGGPWFAPFNAFLDFLGNLLSGFAAANHDHGVGGTTLIESYADGNQSNTGEKHLGINTTNDAVELVADDGSIADALASGAAFEAEHDAAGNHTTFSQPIRATEQAAQPAQPVAGVGGLDWYDDGGVPVVGAWDGDGNFVELIRGGNLMAANPTIQYGSMNISTGANNSDSTNTATIDPVTQDKALVLLTMSAYSSRDTISSLGAVLSIAVSLIDATTVQGAICKNGQTTQAFTASVSFAVIDFSPGE